MCGLRVKNVCLSECKKRGELWGPVSIYRGQKTLKNRYRRLGFEFGHILLWKCRKWCALLSPKGRWAKAHMMAIRHSKSAELALRGRMHFRIRVHLLSPSRVFWPILVPCVFDPRLWFFFSSLFLDDSGFFKNNYIEQLTCW